MFKSNNKKDTVNPTDDNSVIREEYKNYNLKNFCGTAFIGKDNKSESKISMKNLNFLAKNEKPVKSLRIAQKEIDDKYQNARGLVNGNNNLNLLATTTAQVRHRVAVMEDKHKLFSTVTHSLRPR